MRVSLPGSASLALDRRHVLVEAETSRRVFDGA